MNARISSLLLACTILSAGPAAFAQDDAQPANPTAQERAPQSAKKAHKHKHRKGHHAHRRARK